MKRLLSLLNRKPQPEPESPIITVHGIEPSAISPEFIQSVIQWLIASLIHANYFGRAHLFWLDAKEDQGVTKQLKKLIRKREPIFLYRSGDRSFTPPDGYYWRMCKEHKSMRVYQLLERDAG